MSNTTSARAHLLERILAFRDERDWEQFHTPKNLAAALVVEASELLALFQWTPDEELDDRCAARREEIEQEVADTYIPHVLRPLPRHRPRRRGREEDGPECRKIPGRQGKRERKEVFGTIVIA